MEYTIGQLIDSLTITNAKIFKFEDLKRIKGMTDKDIADFTRSTNELNSFRNKLISNIDLKINELVESGNGQELQATNSIKSYGKK